MDFSIFDKSVSKTMNVFLVIGNIINLVYNIPQMVKTYKSKSTKDFSSTFLFMRVVGNSIWLAYSIELNTFLFILSNIVSVVASIFISYYKIMELYRNYSHWKAVDYICELDNVGFIDNDDIILNDGIIFKNEMEKI